MQDKSQQIESATTSLVSDVKAISPPDTPEGQAAKQQLDQLLTDLTSTVAAVKTAAGQIQDAASLVGVTAAVSALAPQVKSLASTAQSALTSLEEAGGSLADAFKSADACQSLSG